MFPWNYGFHWNTGTIIFVGAFYTVLAVLAVTVFAAYVRARRALAAQCSDQIRWHADFDDLPRRDRECRHALAGELEHRECPHGFDCRKCDVHARLVQRRRPAPSGHGEEDIFGMAFPLDRLYDRGHTWARPEADGTVTVGIDELGSRLLGKPDALELPDTGTRIQVNGTAFRVRKRNADVRLLSPVDGEVIETGGPECGWYLKVKPVEGRFDLRHLLCGYEVKPWIMREMERLQLALSAEGAKVPTLADGGTPVEDIAASYPQADWDAVCGEMFLRS